MDLPDTDPAAPISRATPPRPGRLAYVLLAGLAAGTLALLAARFWWTPRDPAPRADDPPAVFDDIEDPEIVNPGYVGSETCLRCHRERAGIEQTKHFRACREPRTREMPIGFQPGRGTVPTRVPGFRFEMLRRGDTFIQAGVQSTPAGEIRTEAPIGLVYGSAPADEVYHLWRGDRLFESKVAWLHPFGMWGHGTLDPYATGDRSRETTTRCVECHNTWLGHVPGTANEYPPGGRLLGVTCENCHGPGRDHTAYHRAHPEARTAHAIVHPGTLSRARAIDVCIQCHSNTARPRGPAFSFRPGDAVDDHFRTASSRHPEEDHVANQIAYLRQSRCFQASEMTCTTCHNPHQSPDHATLQRSCQACHQPEQCRDRPNQPPEVRARCTDCHMPARVWENVHFHTRDDAYKPVVKRFEHRIAVHPEARDAVMRSWFAAQPDAANRARAAELTAKLTRHWLGEAARREGEFRFLAAIGAYREALELGEAPEIRAKLRAATARQARLDDDWTLALHRIGKRQFAEARTTLEGILALKPDHAGAHGKLGLLLAEAGRRVEAETHLRAVADCDPNDAYGWNLLGWLAYLDGRHAEAIEFYRRAAEREPYSPEIQTRLGLALLKLERWPEATTAFQAAATIDPRSALAYHGLANALLAQHRPAEAVRNARRAVALAERQNLEMLTTLADAYAEAGHRAAARAAAEEAVAVARENATPQVERAVRTRFESLLTTDR